jgi:hypothetical protein
MRVVDLICRHLRTWSEIKLLARSVPFALLLSLTGAAQSAIVTYTDETAYLTALDGLGFASRLTESFEDGGWIAARTTPQASVTNLGITWSRPGAFLRTSTGGGDVHDGSYIMFTWDNSSGLPLHAIPDGYTLTSSASSLYAVGGWFQAGTTANLDFIVDGDPFRVDFTGAETALTSAWKFIGFIETDQTLGFTSVQILETDETGDETKIFFSDDFTLGVAAVPVPAALPLFGSGLMGIMGVLGWRRKCS